MNLNDYQLKARETAQYPSQPTYSMAFPEYTNETIRAGHCDYNLNYIVKGLAGEVGEFLNKLKKIERDRGYIIDSDGLISLRDELGDILWYLSMSCFELGLEFDDVAQENLDKLKSRQDRGTIVGDGDDR